MIKVYRAIQQNLRENLGPSCEISIIGRTGRY